MAVRTVATIAGAALVLAGWLSVMRTVFIPRYRSTLAARSITRVVATILTVIARCLRPVARQYVLGLGAPVTLFALACTWLVATLAGFALLAWGSARVGLGGYALAGFFLLRQAGTSPDPAAVPLAALAWLSTTLTLAAFTTHLVRVTDAYSRRERPVIRLAAQATRPPDAETLITRYLGTGSRDHLGAMFGEWASWLADIEGTHLAYPVLVQYRQAGDLCWIRAAVIVLDCAALSQACAPDWSPPEAYALLAAGGRCLQGIAAQLGVNLPRIPVSYHGRETCPFNGTVAKVREAGLPLALSEAEVQAKFQRLRIQYAPYANAIADRLCCDLGAEEER